jgi:glycosyltransferase involved in cell wall biosynthesis
MLLPYFAPQTHAAMFRAHKLAKYLVPLGYRPVVVTPDINYLYNDDMALLGELPEEVEVHRARYVEPTARGLRMALGGRDRTFAATKRAAGPHPEIAPTSRNVTDAKPRADRAWAQRVSQLLGDWPDRHWTWRGAARRRCRELIRAQQIRLLYTSAVPASPLAVAASLQREFGLKWVADFRDPVGYGQKHSAAAAVPLLMERRLYANAMARADMVTGLAGSYGSIFFDLYGLPESRYRFIPTGLDEAYVSKASAEPDSHLLLHVGEVMPNQSRHAFDVLARAYTVAPSAMAGMRLVFVGRREVNAPLVAALIGAVGDWPYPVEFIDHVPQPQVYRLIKQARACLLIPGTSRFWWNNFAKLVDYLALDVPVIADVPPVSEAREELSKGGKGFFLGGADINADARALVDWLAQDLATTSTGYGRRYTALRQAEDFAAVFDEVLGHGGAA